MGSYCELLAELINWPDKPDSNNVKHNFSVRPNQRRLLMNLIRLALGLPGIRNTARGVQYVHWVMHKCIMVKVGGNEIHVKYVKSR